MDDLEVLGLEPGFTEAQLKQAFRERARKIHPDHRGGDWESHWQMIRLNQAYNALKGLGTGVPRADPAPTPAGGRVAPDPAYALYRRGMDEFQAIHPSGWVRVSGAALFNRVGAESRGEERAILSTMLTRISRAYTLFSAVVNDHPGSPWGADASAKLKALDVMAVRYAKILHSFS